MITESITREVDAPRHRLYTVVRFGFAHVCNTEIMSEQNTFELDLLDFHGDKVQLSYEQPGATARWLVEDADAALDIDDDEPFRAQLVAQLVGRTVHIDGTVEGTFFFRCGRCLEWRQIDLDEDVEFVLMSRDSWTESYEGEEEIALEESDMDVSYYEGEIIDLRPLLREAVLLELPDFPVCPERLSEACDTAYERVVGEETLEENEANSMDLRWSKLKEIELDDDDS